MGNLAFQDVDLLLSDIQRSAPNREFLGLQSVQELAKAVQFIGCVGVVHKPMIGRWPLLDQTGNLTASFNLYAATSVLAAPSPCYIVLSGLHISALLTKVR
jgi:hypothetical protein